MSGLRNAFHVIWGTRDSKDDSACYWLFVMCLTWQKNTKVVQDAYAAFGRGDVHALVAWECPFSPSMPTSHHQTPRAANPLPGTDNSA
jgi:hypothetical protein